CSAHWPDYRGGRGYGDPPPRVLDSLEKHLRAPLPVVERLAARGQLGHVAGAEALLEEPVRGVCGEGEKAPDAQAPGAFLAGFEQVLAVARVAIAFGDRETGGLGALFLLEGVKRRAADDHSVVLDHEEVADLGLEQLAAALHER